MHEVSLAQEILQIVQSASIQEHFSKVENLRIEIGDLAGIEPDALEFALTGMAVDTLLEDTKITILSLPGTGYCEPCAERVSITFIHSPCPRCGHQPLIAIKGTELRILDLEVQ